MRRVFLAFILIGLVACSTPQVATPTATQTSPVGTTPPPTQTDFPTVTLTPQPTLAPIPYGPDIESFPENVNPLTGIEVSDPSLLKLPAMLVSISNMPFTARPQAGPGFAPWVYELYIGEGATRFMNVFYGQYPRSVPNITGGCKVRDEISHSTGNWVGNRVWLDENANGQQDDWEMGVGGVCVHLLDASNREVLKETSTDSNGYYAFDSLNLDLLIQFELPEGYQFSAANIGDDVHDSDVDINGEIAIPANSSGSFWDAGLILTDGTIATPNPSATATPWYIPTEDYVGPIRSGRLTYTRSGACSSQLSRLRRAAGKSANAGCL